MRCTVLVLATWLCACSSGPREYDYYLLALSWSPQYCAETGLQRGEAQCRQAHGFVVHGLWPQFSRGGWPEYCALDTTVDRGTVAAMLSLMPSEALIRHQWRKHGSCAAADPADYFDRVRTARATVHAPSPIAADEEGHLTMRALRMAWLQRNPHLPADGVAFVCRGQYLREVRVCLDRELAPRSCGLGVRDRCPPEIRVRPPLRGEDVTGAG